jgi:hypothetical protein
MLRGLIIFLLVVVPETNGKFDDENENEEDEDDSPRCASPRSSQNTSWIPTRPRTRSGEFLSEE